MRTTLRRIGGDVCGAGKVRKTLPAIKIQRCASPQLFRTTEEAVRIFAGAYFSLRMASVQ
jgi:hypothetical protein